ncbi:hypothetical protein IQ07DRAFT_585899 [Pyrenochaeta sp. DS3sAY3a]|nr:hypothetical protein IQ07DRAFT_585899 [Pyrenochaeta sp. DS3sAY3a]
MRLSTVLLLAVAFVTADPLPAVTPRLISSPQSCRAWPVNPFQIIVDSAEDPAVNSLPAQPYDIVFPSKVLPLLAIDLRASRRFAKVLYSCNAGRLKMRSGVGERLDICQDRENAHILLNAPAEKVLVPELYEHVVDGQALPGRYLGVKGQTTWGFRYTPASCSANGTLSERDYYEVKLLGLPESEHDTIGYEIEFKGFLKIAADW